MLVNHVPNPKCCNVADTDRMCNECLSLMNAGYRVPNKAKRLVPPTMEEALNLNQRRQELGLAPSYVGQAGGSASSYKKKLVPLVPPVINWNE